MISLSQQVNLILLKNLLKKLFNYFDLDCQKYIDFDEELLDLLKIFLSKADPSGVEKLNGKLSHNLIS